MMKINNTTIFFKGEQRFLRDEKQKITEWTQSGWITRWQQHILVPAKMGSETKKNATWRPPKHTHKHVHVIDFFLWRFLTSKVVHLLQNPNAPQYRWSAIAQIVMSLGGQWKGPCQMLLQKELWENIENCHHGINSHQEFFFLLKIVFFVVVEPTPPPLNGSRGIESFLKQLKDELCCD